MDTIYRLYDFLAGPCLYITVPLCIAGLLRKAIIIISGRDRGLRFPALRNEGFLKGIAVTPAGRDPLLAVAGTLFHLAIFTAPLTARAHAILLDAAWNVMPPLVNPAVTSVLTAVAIFSGIFLLLRRTFVGRVLAVSSWRDYAAMTCVMVPFVTGLLAGEMIGPYEIVMIIHCAGAHVLLLAIGWTRLGHMVFFTAGRFASRLTGRVNA